MQRRTAPGDARCRPCMFLHNDQSPCQPCSLSMDHFLRKDSSSVLPQKTPCHVMWLVESMLCTAEQGRTAERQLHDARHDSTCIPKHVLELANLHARAEGDPEWAPGVFAIVCAHDTILMRFVLSMRHAGKSRHNTASSSETRPNVTWPA